MGNTLANLWCMLLGCEDCNFLPTNGFSIKPLKVKLLAGEQKATEKWLVGIPQKHERSFSTTRSSSRGKGHPPCL